MYNPSARDDLVASEDSRSPGPPSRAQGYGDRNKGRSERPQHFTGEAKSWLPLEDREGEEPAVNRNETYNPEIWHGRPLRGRVDRPTGSHAEKSHIIQ